MSFCPFCCSQYGSRQSCDSSCKMWVDGDCIIKKGFVALAQTFVKSSGSEI
jgi:hypothetical protein